MSFTAACPFCGKAYQNVDDAHRGSRARCGRCNHSFYAQPITPAAQSAAQRARDLKVPFVRVAAIPIDPVLASKLPRDVLRRHVAVPAGRRGDELIVAMADPLDLVAVDDLRRHYPQIRAVMGLSDEILAALEALPTPEELASAEAARQLQAVGGSLLANRALEDLLSEHGDVSATEAAETADTVADQSPARRAVDAILGAAVEAGATEVRVMEHQGNIVAQGRTAEGLKALEVSEDVPYHRLVARFKNEAGCDPTQRGVEQNGSIPFSHGGRDYEFLLTILPARDQERILLRVLDAAVVKQRRAAERRQKVEEALLALRGSAWPPPGARVDPSAARDFVAETVEQQPAAVRLAMAVLFHALDHGAQDIVLEPSDGGLRVLQRGTTEHFEPAMQVPSYAAKPLMARFQIMSNIDLTYSRESRLGVFFLLRSGKAYEVRMATVPTDAGTIGVLHIFPRAQ